jgi:hypothetical protein
MAMGRWVNGDRFIETHVRVALGLALIGSGTCWGGWIRGSLAPA